MSFKLADAYALGKDLASTPGVVREVTPIALTLWKMWNGRVKNGGEERVVDGVPEEAWTEGLAQTNADQLTAWMAGRSDYRPTWTCWPDSDSTWADNLPPDVESASRSAVDLIWTSGS
jgi:hypothetical protein